MPSRAESRIAPVPLLTVGGVNQRAYPTELPPHEFGNLDGVFPEFAGLQSRMFGKRLLKKYDDPIYGIFQFWTPQGYGGGLYQFNGSLDFGIWLTPNSTITLDPLPGAFDGGGMTLDDFGQSYGSNFGYGAPNTCVLSFLNGSSDHSSCNPPPSPANTPDDHNGGPAGQGKKCKWTQGNDLEISIPVPEDTQFGTWSMGPTHTGSGPLPYPIPPSIPTQRPTAYSPGGGGFGNIWFASCDSTSAKVNLGGGAWSEIQSASSQNTTGTLDISGSIDPDNPPSLIEILVRHNGNAPFVSTWMPFAGGTPDDWSAVPIDVWDYIQTTYRTDPNPVGGGFVISDFVVLDRIRFSYHSRVCE